MKKKLIIALIALIAIVIMLSLSVKKEDTQGENNENDSLEKIELNWSDVYTLSVLGEEGRTLTSLEMKDIPQLHERIDQSIISLQEEKSEKAALGEELEGFDDKLSKLNIIREKKDFCKLKESYDALKNGDTIEVICDDEILKILGYVTDKGFSRKIDGLLEATEQVPEVQVETEKTYSDLKNNFVVRENDMYVTTKSGDYAYVYPKDLKNFTLDEQYKNTKYVIIEIESDDEYADALAIAKRYDNIIAIKNGAKAWTINSNFEEVVGWLGMSD